MLRGGFVSGSCRRIPPTAALTVLLVVSAGASISSGRTLARWDFTRGTHGWQGNRVVEEVVSTTEGLLVRCKGRDPWIEGPVVEIPGPGSTIVKIRMKSTADARGQLFYGRTFSEDRSIRFTVHNDGKWHDYCLAVPHKLAGPTRFRLDPGAGAGQITIGFIEIQAVGQTAPPPFGRPRLPSPSSSPYSVSSGAVELVHYKGRWGNFVVNVGGREMAAGHQGGRIGIVFGDEDEWLNLGEAPVTLDSAPEGGLTSTATLTDSRGAKWRICRSITPGAADALNIRVQLSVDKDREVVFIPWITIFPGLGTFGTSKDQGLFAGLEYLCDEPSSSTADVAAPNNIRRIPDPVKITFPLMAISRDGFYIGLIWEPSAMVAAAFDSPDRIYNSGAQVMELSAPAVGQLRFENAACAHTPFRLGAGRPLTVEAVIIGGRGETVVEAVKRYVELKGLPQVPRFEGGFGAAVRLLAAGWLDSQINRDGLFRHAVWAERFRPLPAADAAMYIDWLSGHTGDSGLRGRLLNLRDKALSRIPATQPFSSSIGHAHQIAAPFVLDRLERFIRQRRAAAAASLKRFDEDGLMYYRAGPVDYSRTHFAKHSNGLSGRVVAGILEAASLCGDRHLKDKALDLLDKQTALYAGTVPRGAQTWEIPLHTPDILASAHLVKAYTLGYVVSGEKEYLDQARYWAWSGVPFVYLRQPTAGPVGYYATIAVLGATNWKAPVWFGRPVQWCGLVYASALHLLSEFDPGGPWERIARGITAAGLQMTWPISDSDRGGLLPDWFDLRSQVRGGPAINPGTVQAHLPELFRLGKIYEINRLAGRGWVVHAPTEIEAVSVGKRAISIRLAGWAYNRQYRVLIAGPKKPPKEVLARRLFADAEKVPAPEVAETRFHSDLNCLIITLAGPAQIEIVP